MSYTYRKMHIPSSKYSIKSPYTMTPEYLTVHNTFNDAPAKNEASYHNNNNNQVSFHIAIDEIEAIEVVPLNRTAWHCGDGKGNGNMKSIGIEICYSKSGGSRYDKAEQNAVLLIAKMLHERNWGIDRVKKHQDWSGKYCPHRILDKKNGWQDFLNRVQKELDRLNGKSPTPSINKPTQNSTEKDEIMLNDAERKSARSIIKLACQQGVFDPKVHTDAKINSYTDSQLASYMIIYITRKINK